jgi:hypothetical protein
MSERPFPRRHDRFPRMSRRLPAIDQARKVSTNIRVKRTNRRRDLCMYCFGRAASHAEGDAPRRNIGECALADYHDLTAGMTSACCGSSFLACCKALFMNSRARS